MSQADPTAQPLLDVRDLRAQIPGSGELRLSFGVHPRELLQLAGPSGCGKTTVLRMLARLSAPAAGQLRLAGEPAMRVPPQTWRRQVLYLAQQPVMLAGSVRKNLLAGYATSSAPPPPPGLEQRAAQLLTRLGLDSDHLLEQDARLLSGGEAARVALARALLVEPRVLLADEPTAALDQDNARAMTTLLADWASEGGALLLVAHDPAPWDGIQLRQLHLRPAASDQERADA